MKRRDVTLLAFVGICVLQLCAPLSMIAKRELVLQGGDVVRIRTAPVDPYDAFRGRYVALRLELGSVKNPVNLTLTRHQRVYVPFGTNEQGFAEFGDVELTRPVDGVYLATRVQSWDSRKKIVNVEIPFDRYYLNEKDAPEAEAAYRGHSRGETRDAYVDVRVLRGYAVIEELYVGGKPVLQFVRDGQ